MTDKAKGTVPVNGKSLELETAVIYKIGKTTVTVERVFRSENAITLNDIIVRLIKNEAQNLR